MTPTFKNKVLGFDLIGEGNLPSVYVVRPALRNSSGNPMLQFRRLLVGRRHTLPLVLRNHGNVPAKVRHIPHSICYLGKPFLFLEVLPYIITYFIDKATEITNL